MENTRYKDLFKHLKTKGFSVYSPGQKKGECTTPYIVVRDGGTSVFVGISSTQTLYDLMCYVPQDKYTTLESFIDSVDLAMKELYPMFKSLHSRTAPFFDEDAKAHMSSTQYINYKKFYNN